jgi:hypothetical protein
MFAASFLYSFTPSTIFKFFEVFGQSHRGRNIGTRLLSFPFLNSTLTQTPQLLSHQVHFSKKPSQRRTWKKFTMAALEAKVDALTQLLTSSISRQEATIQALNQVKTALTFIATDIRDLNTSQKHLALRFDGLLPNAIPESPKGDLSTTILPATPQKYVAPHLKHSNTSATLMSTTTPIRYFYKEATSLIDLDDDEVQGPNTQNGHEERNSHHGPPPVSEFKARHGLGISIDLSESVPEKTSPGSTANPASLTSRGKPRKYSVEELLALRVS